MYSDAYYQQREREWKEAFDKVQSGEWTYGQFEDFILQVRSDAKREVE